MLVLARLFEEGGLSTVLVTMMPSWAEQYGVPRALAIEYPFAHPLGMPRDEATQTRIIRQALDVLAEAEGPNTIVHSPEVWPGNEAEWRKRWQPSGASPSGRQVPRRHPLRQAASEKGRGGSGAPARRDLNPRHPGPKPGALSAELRADGQLFKYRPRTSSASSEPARRST